MESIDLTNADLDGIENFVAHSDVIMTDAQFASFDSVIFEGEGTHTLTIVDDENGNIDVLDMHTLSLAEGSGNLNIIDSDEDTELNLSNADDNSENGDIIVGGEVVQSKENISVGVENDGESMDASDADYTFTFAEGNYTYTVDNFEAGDILDLPDSPSPTVVNSSYDDGSVDLQWAANGQVLTVYINWV